MRLLMVFMLFGCAGDEIHPSPDAPDAQEEIPLCCTLLPDEDAARSCIAATVPEGNCGVLACPSLDGLRRINFCGSMPK